MPGTEQCVWKTDSSGTSFSFTNAFFIVMQALVHTAKESQLPKEQRKAHAVQQEAGNLLSLLLGEHMKRWFGLNPAT